jgi:hypothetical protein
MAVAQAVADEPWCHRVGGCPYPDAGTPANPLTGDHAVALRAGGDPRQAPIVLCRRCNSAKGAGRNLVR